MKAICGECLCSFGSYPEGYELPSICSQCERTKPKEDGLASRNRRRAYDSNVPRNYSGKRFIISGLKTENIKQGENS